MRKITLIGHLKYERANNEMNKIVCGGRAAGKVYMQEQIEEYHNLMRAGLDEVAVQEYETAAEYFSDAAYVLNKIANEDIRAELASMYEVNPYDYVK